jgi:hypothetical protein
VVAHAYVLRDRITHLTMYQVSLSSGPTYRSLIPHTCTLYHYVSKHTRIYCILLVSAVLPNVHRLVNGIQTFSASLSRFSLILSLDFAYCTALYGGDSQMTVTSPNSQGRRDRVEGDRDSRQFGRPLSIFFWIFCDFFQCHADFLTTEATVTVTHRDGGDATAPP